MNRNLERVIRTIAALNLDELSETDYLALEAAQDVCVREVEQIDRARSAEKERKARRTEGWWSLTAARKVVKARSGGRCELAGPGCQGRAREVHHVHGRGGYDPHNPAKLLHLCGHGNIDGCHGWVHQTREGRDAAMDRTADLSAEAAS